MVRSKDELQESLGKKGRCGNREIPATFYQTGNRPKKEKGFTYPRNWKKNHKVCQTTFYVSFPGMSLVPLGSETLCVSEAQLGP